MMKKRFKVGDTVRVLVNNYMTWVKMEANMFPIELIVKDSKNFGKEFTITRTKGIFFKYYQILANEDISCPYKIGDFVRFKPQCSKKDLWALCMNNPNLNYETEYKILKIMYDYYIYIDIDMTDDWKKTHTKKLYEQKMANPTQRSLPLRWIDFEKVDS